MTKPRPLPAVTKCGGNRTASPTYLATHLGVEHVFLAIIRDRQAVPTQVLSRITDLDERLVEFVRNYDKGGSSREWWSLTDQEKFSAFGVPVVVLANADPDTSRWVGLDRIDDKPATLDVVYGREQGAQVIHVRNVRTYDPPLRVEFSDLARTTLSELLLQCEYFRRDSDEGRPPQRARSEEFLEQLRNQTPEPGQLVLDGSTVEARSFERAGFLTAEAATPGSQVIVAGPADMVNQCELRTTELE